MSGALGDVIVCSRGQGCRHGDELGPSHRAQLLDGPGAGVELKYLHRRPEWLRVVHGPDGWNALDQLTDTPDETETVHVYALVDWFHGRGEGWVSTWQHVDVDGEQLRETMSWQTWVQETIGARCDPRGRPLEELAS